MCPCDGKVLHFGKVNENSELIEQVKGVQYSLSAFLGPGLLERTSNPDPVDSKLPHKGSELYHVVIYLGPGDNHHFYSPTDWSLNIARHIPGKLNLNFLNIFNFFIFRGVTHCCPLGC